MGLADIAVDQESEKLFLIVFLRVFFHPTDLAVVPMFLPGSFRLCFSGFFFFFFVFMLVAEDVLADAEEVDGLCDAEERRDDNEATAGALRNTMTRALREKLPTWIDQIVHGRVP